MFCMILDQFECLVVIIRHRRVPRLHTKHAAMLRAVSRTEYAFDEFSGMDRTDKTGA